MRVDIALLGRFAVSVDGVPVPSDRWRRRQAAALVKLLALAPGARMHRDRVIDALWPDVDLDAALPRLHKAAHYARQALAGDEPGDAVVLKGETVALFPGVPVEVDVAAFEAAAAAALDREAPSVEACTAAIARYGGELLPDDVNEPWSQEPRLRLRARWERLLRGAHRWQELLLLDPADEQAHVELLREAVDAGDRAAALRRYDELATNLHKGLGVEPGPEAVALRERVLAVPERRSDRPRISETLVERDDELTVLLRTAHAVTRTGRGAVVLVTGEAGSGKSSVTRAFLDRVEGQLLVAAGGCDDLLAPRGLAPFRDMAEALPDLARALSAEGHPDDVFPALLRFVAARPTVLVVEDVHWADDVTLDAIRYLSRRIAGVPAILLLTFRPEDVGATHPLRGILGGLGSSSVRRLELAPLSVDAVRRLGGVDDGEAAEIHRVTHGNPFFVTEVLDAGVDAIPPTVRDAVLARVGRLPPAARRLVQRLAVVPSRAELWLAEALAGEDPDALAEAERSGVVSAGTDHVAFRHELARRAIETSLTVGERVRANREVLAGLLQRPHPEPSRIVHHAEHAVRPDLLARYGPVAADAAQRAGAHRQAAETLRVVLAHAEDLDATVRAVLLTRRAYSLYVVNDYDAALGVAESAVSLAEDVDDPVVLAEALMVLSRIVLFAGGPVRARAAAGRAVEILEPLGDDARLAAALIELARVHSNLATPGIVAQPSADAVRYAARALELCDRLDRDDLRAQALCYLGSGRLALGDPGGFDDIARAVAVGATDGPRETRVRTYVNAAGSAYRAGRFADARAYVATGLSLAADGEFAAGRYRLRLTSAAVSASEGAWDAAVAELRELVTSPGRPGVMAVLARSLLARVLARRGDPECVAVLAEALDDPSADGDSYVAGPLAVAQLEVGWLTGTLDGVPPLVERAVELAARSGHTAMRGELAGYLRRAGLAATAPADVPGPWAPALAGRWADAAVAWEALGERYERAVELASPGADDAARTTGLAVLADLGAHATVRALTRSSTAR